MGLCWNKGTKAVEGISLNNINLKDLHLNLSCQVFDKMPNLRLLLFTHFSESNKVHLPHGLNSLPDELMIIEWDKYPLRALPSNFSPEKLVKLDLSYSNIEQLWKGTKPAPKLKQLILGFCPRLTRIPNLSDFLSLEEVNLIGCQSLVEFPSSVQQLKKLQYLSLLTCYSPTNFGCNNVTKFPPISASIERLYLSGTAIKEVPSSIQSLTNLKSLYLSKCTRLKHIPSSICDLTSLEELNLSNCSKLDKLPENMGNLKFLKDLNVGGSGICQLPSSITCLENLEFLNCSSLTILPPLMGFCSLSRLCLNNCNLKEIPEDIGCLSSLKWLNLGGNMFESLPKSIKHLSKLEGLSISNCNMLRSLTELPALEWLEAINCKQLCQALPDAYEFKCFITSKNFTYHEYVKFLFTNSFNVNQKAVSKFFEESLKGLEEPPTQFYIYLPGTEIPEWFTYQSSGSSVNIQVLRQDLVNRKIMGFAICAVLGFEEYHNDNDFLSVIVSRHFETYDDHIIFPQYNAVAGHKAFINSDHILLGYPLFTKFYPLSQNLEKIFAGDSDYMDISFKIKAMSKDYKVKHYAVHPIYAEPKEIIGATIEDIGETSGRRSGRSDDIEEVEPTS